MATTYKFKAYYKAAGVGAVMVPAPVCTVINMADDSKLADAQATTASTNMPGLYTYSYTGNDGLDCVAYFHTTDVDADEADVASYVSDKITTNLNADVAGVETKVDTIDTNVDTLITGVNVSSIANGAITAAAIADNAIDAGAIAADAIDADALKTDAITKIQNGLALEATLTAIKGAGWTNETLAKIVVDISNISAGSGATAQEVWEYATRVLTAGTNIDLSSLATTTHLQEVEDKVDGIKAKTDNLPTDPADDSDIDTAIAAVKTVVDAIKTETDGHPTAAEVWSYGTRTLTNSTTGAVTPAEGDTLEVTKDATIIINFTGLGDISAYDDDTTDEEDKVWFTAKANLDDPDSSAVIQIHTLYPAGTTPPDTLDYINGAAATATEGTFQFTDLVAGNATLTLSAAAAADLPVYAVSPLYWDIKILDYSAGTVSVLASGEMYIYGTPTKSIA